MAAYDQAAQGSTAQACAFALDRLATELTRCTHGTGTLDGTADGTRLVQVRADVLKLLLEAARMSLSCFSRELIFRSRFGWCSEIL